MRNLTKRINAATFNMINSAQMELYELLKDELPAPQMRHARRYIKAAKRCYQRGEQPEPHIKVWFDMLTLMALCR